MKENLFILIQMSLMFAPKGPIDSKSALVQVMAWHRRWLAYRHMYVSLSLNGLMEYRYTTPWCFYWNEYDPWIVNKNIKKKKKQTWIFISYFIIVFIISST